MPRSLLNTAAFAKQLEPPTPYQPLTSDNSSGTVLMRQTLNAIHDIFEDSGGNSLQILERILHANSMLIAASCEEINARHIEKYGPGLVSAFRIHEDFMSTSKLSFVGKPVGAYLGLHAMVLIGVRESRSGKRFLLQNWWRTCQFVEVDLDYLRACRAQISFVETPQTSIPPRFPVSVDLYDETEFIDKSELWAEGARSMTCKTEAASSISIIDICGQKRCILCRSPARLACLQSGLWTFG
jgi:hypothetical protein